VIEARRLPPGVVDASDDAGPASNPTTAERAVGAEQPSDVDPLGGASLSALVEAEYSEGKGECVKERPSASIDI
jgi:hypothetical protein